MEEHGIAQGIGLQREVHRCRPVSTSIQQLLAHTCGEITDAALGNAILEMGIDATNGKVLVRVVTCLLKGVVGESPIVAMIM